MALGSWIDGFIPSTGPNTAGVTIRILGDFDPNYHQVRIETSEGDVIRGTVTHFAENAYRIDWEGSQSGDIITVSFDLSGAATGDYYVVVEDLYGDIYSNSLFTVGPIRETELWVSLTGQAQVRGGATTDFIIWYGNLGNASPLPSGVLFVGIPKGLNYTLGFDPQEYALPEVKVESITGTAPDDVQYEMQWIPTKFEATFNGLDYIVLRLHIQDIPPVSQTPLKISVTWGIYDWGSLQGQPVDHLIKAWWSGGKPDNYLPAWPMD